MSAIAPPAKIALLGQQLHFSPTILGKPVALLTKATSMGRELEGLVANSSPDDFFVDDWAGICRRIVTSAFALSISFCTLVKSAANCNSKIHQMLHAGKTKLFYRGFCEALVGVQTHDRYLLIGQITGSP
jgi:hypothetical protein